MNHAIRTLAAAVCLVVFSAVLFAVSACTDKESAAADNPSSPSGTAEETSDVQAEQPPTLQPSPRNERAPEPRSIEGEEEEFMREFAALWKAILEDSQLTEKAGKETKR